jgi:hypothetical protein
MYDQDLKNFYNLLQRDTDVQKRLMDGDKDGFSARAVAIGAENGLSFTEEDVMAAVYAGQSQVTDIEIDSRARQACIPSSGGLMSLMAVHLQQKND